MKNKTTKTFIAIVIALIGIVSASLLIINTTKTIEKETVKIGWIGPLTGSATFLAEDGLYTAQIAVDEINSNGGIDGKQIELIVEDDKYNPKETLNAYEKLTKIDNVKYIMDVQYGSYDSIAEKAKQNGVLLFDALDCNNHITGLGDHVFCLGIESESIARVASDYATGQNYGQVGVLYFNSDTFMPYVKDHFTEIFGGEVIAEPYKAGETDFKTQLLKIREADVDGIAMFGYDELGIAMRQARELGMNAQFFSNTAPQSPALQKLSGDAVEGTIFSYWELKNPERESVVQFYEKFEKKEEENLILIH